MRYLFLCVLLAACGGAVEDGAPSPAPATNAPNSIASGDGCTRACDRMTKTCAAFEDSKCVDSCASDFESTEQSATFAACIDALSCEEIRRGAFMDVGPITECWLRAGGR